MALKISAVNWCKKNIFISTYVEFYREQGHIHFLTMHWKIWAADAKKYFFEGLSVYLDGQFGLNIEFVLLIRMANM